MHKHKWKLDDNCSMTGKIRYRCPRCGLTDNAPPPQKYEMRPCDPQKYRDLFYSEEREDLHERFD